MSTMSFFRYSSKLSSRLDVYRRLIADEVRLPDIKGRHVFTAKLRIILFLMTWVMFFLFFPSVFVDSPFVVLAFNVGFFLTALCHWIIISQNRIILSVIALEVIADIMSQIVVVYLLGLETWAPFLIFGLYVIAVGILSGYHAALFASTATLIAYNLLFILIHAGYIAPFEYDPAGAIVNLKQLKPYLNLIFLPVVLVLIVYSVRIANFFSHVKEKALEKINVQLSALNNIGATIRSSLNVQNVIDEVLKAVIQGLGFEVCLLALVSEKERKVKFFVPGDNYYAIRLEEITGTKISDISLPFGVRKNSAHMAILKNKVLVRNNLSELVNGLVPEISLHQSVRAQKVLGFKKFVITPLVAEQKVVGAIIGISCQSYVEESVVNTLDNFANQAALAIESAQLFEEIREKNEELVKAGKMKSEFLAIMSHELRTPLNAVIGYTEALMEGVSGDLNDEQKLSLKEVLRNGQNLLEMINSVLDLAKIESGRMNVSLDDFDLVELAENTQSSLNSLITKKDLTFEIHSEKKLPFITADSVKLRQILNNIIGNAIKFTNRGGNIDFFIEHHESSDEIIKQHFKGMELHDDVKDKPVFLLRLKDTGVGIRDEDLESIFEIFQQADSSVTRHHEGSGLGLALTKQLVLLHMGLIAITSSYGEGTEVKILLPQRDPEYLDPNLQSH